MVVSTPISVKISKFRNSSISVGSCVFRDIFSSLSRATSQTTKTNLSLRTKQHERTVEASLRASARFIAFIHKRYPPTRRVLPPSLWKNDHPSKHARRQSLHALALLGRQLAPDEKVCEGGEDIMLRRHERDLSCAMLCERVARVHESRLDDFLAAVGCGQAVLHHAGGETG